MDTFDKLGKLSESKILNQQFDRYFVGFRPFKGKKIVFW